MNPKPLELPKGWRLFQGVTCYSETESCCVLKSGTLLVTTDATDAEIKQALKLRNQIIKYRAMLGKGPK
jgi:hypothetical protein